MKKLLCLVLSLIMTLSCFGLVASAEGEQDLLYRPDGSVKPDGEVSEDIVGKVIDPILAGKNTSFADSINELGYASVNSLAASSQKLTKENFDSFITANADDEMFGVDYDFLYSKDTSAFFWSFLRYELETDDNIHETEVAEAVSEGRYSTCSMKGAYDACAEVLDGYRYSYSLKETDQEIFADIIEEKVTVYNSYTKKDEIHYNYYYDFTKGAFSLMRANGNNQIVNTVSKVWQGDRLYADTETANENAIKIANFIGKLFYPNFVEIQSDTVIFTDNKKMDAYDFFAKVTEISGLDDILQNNWCNATTFDVKEIMAALGVNTSENVLLNVETEKGVYMGARILTDMYREFFENPVVYVQELIQLLCKSYTYSFKKPIEALFLQKYPSMAAKSRSGAYSELDAYDGSELSSVDGLLNFITDCIYVSKVDGGDTEADRFGFAPLPVNRIVNASDINELHLYFLCYFELNRVYENNAKMIELFIDKVYADLKGNYKSSTNSKPDDIAETKAVLRSMFLGELTMVDVLSFHLSTLTENTIENFSPNFFSNLKNSLLTLFQKFIDAMDSFMNLLFGWTGGILG